MLYRPPNGSSPIENPRYCGATDDGDPDTCSCFLSAVGVRLLNSRCPIHARPIDPYTEVDGRRVVLQTVKVIEEEQDARLAPKEG